MYAEIAINAPVQKTFEYHIPPELEGKIQPGHLVQVPFATAMQHGVVLSLTDETDIAETKPIIARLDPRPFLNAHQIDLARWISRTYLAPIGPCIWLMLPPGITGGRDIQVTLLNPSGKPADSLEGEVIALLKKRGPLRGRQLDLSLTGKSWHSAVEGLEKAGIVESERILLPPRVRPKTVQTVALAIHPDEIDTYLPYLERPSKSADVLEEVVKFNGGLLRMPSNRAQVDKLVEAGLVQVADDQTISLTIPPKTVPEALRTLRKVDKSLRILHLLANEGRPVDLSWVYAQLDVSLNDLKKLADEGLVILGEKATWRDSLAERDYVPSAPPALTPEQRAAWKTLEAAIEHQAGVGASSKMKAVKQEIGTNFLLHGVTGSGKTEIYLRAIAKTLELGRSAILLVPEIALTAQTVRRVATRFGKDVAVLHSGLSEGERHDTWRRAREGLVRVIVGARSALFAPLKDVGLIVLDEEHDSSYKQGDSASGLPHYHARHVAEEMMRRRNGVLVLGSATPDLETTFRAQRGDLQLLHMPSRIMGHRTRIMEQAEREGVVAKYEPTNAEDALTIDLPPVRVIDMRDELKSGNTSIFSRRLQLALKEALGREEQVILYLNRRGQSTYVFCRDCGYVAVCPRCDTPLTYHRQGQALRCHRCAYEMPEPQICPNCRSARIKFFGAGTQHVEQALHQMFPRARTLRWDADTADKPEDHEGILQRFIERKADVLVGTQMVAKGLDLPLVTLVGVVSADLGLALPDFRATERTFQLLTQVAGRAGRGLRGGQVVLQTYQPDHYVIAAAAKHDYEGFYEREINYRKELGYPPFRRFVRIVFRYPQEERARSEAERAAETLRRRIKSMQLTGTDLIGPAPCFFTKVNRVFRWHLLLRGPDPTAALEGLEIGRGWVVDVDPVDVL